MEIPVPEKVDSSEQDLVQLTRPTSSVFNIVYSDSGMHQFNKITFIDVRIFFKSSKYSTDGEQETGLVPNISSGLNEVTKEIAIRLVRINQYMNDRK